MESAGHAPRVPRDHGRLVAGVCGAWVCDRLPARSRSADSCSAPAKAAGFPAATKAVAEWFPARERSTAMGIINAGTAIGAVVAPPLIAGDRALRRLAVGVHGVRRRRAAVDRRGGSSRIKPLLTTPGFLLMAASTPQRRRQGARGTRPFRPVRLSLLRLRAVWGLVVAKFLTDGAWYFYLFWLPKYLYDARGFDVKQVGYYAWIPLRRCRRRKPDRRLPLSSWLLTRGKKCRLRAQGRARRQRRSDAAHRLRHPRARRAGPSCSSASRSSASSHGRPW